MTTLIADSANKKQLVKIIEGFSDFYDNYKNIDPPKSLTTIIQEYVDWLSSIAGEEKKADKDELLPCPFCGGKAVINQTGKKELTIKCPSCVIKHTQKTLRYDLDWLKEKMIETWNRRAPQSKVDAAEGEEKQQESTNDEKRYILLSNLVFGYSEWAEKQSKQNRDDVPNDDPGTYFATEGKEYLDQLFPPSHPKEAEGKPDEKPQLRWVKCKDRLPGDKEKLYQIPSDIIIRRIDNKSVIKEYFNLYGEKWGLENFEWLDETAAGKAEDGEQEKLWLELQKQVDSGLYENMFDDTLNLLKSKFHITKKPKQ